MKKTIVMGTFDCTCGQIGITDPSANTASLFTPVKKGTWEIKAVYNEDGKVFSMRASLSGITETDLAKMDGQMFTNPVKVTGGIIGIFDAKSFHRAAIDTQSERLEEMRNKTLTPELGGMVSRGAVVVPGGGNGEYTVFCLVDKMDRVVQVSIDFLADFDNVNFGTFECTSGKLMISDPSYKTGTWCQGVLHNAKTGIWKAGALISDEDKMGKRVATLYAFHTSLAEEEIEKLPVIKSDMDVGVDSGQAGIFDNQYYQDDSVVTEPVVGGLSDIIHTQRTGEPGAKWYDLCSSKTLPRSGYGGVIPYGVVSASGFGDGGYTCYYQKNAEGEVVHIMIEFLEDKHRLIMKQLLIR